MKPRISCQINHLFLEIEKAVHGTFTVSVYQRVPTCTPSVYQAVYNLPAKSTCKPPDFDRLTCDMARKNRSPQAFLLAFS
jgi:hypothetical protein